MRIVYSTFPSKESAVEIGKKLLGEKLIACYNTFKISSGYWWQGEITEDEEWACIFKTGEKHVEKVIETIAKLHPYEVPAIFSIPVEMVHSPYEKWLKENLE